MDVSRGMVVGVNVVGLRFRGGMAQMIWMTRSFLGRDFSEVTSTTSTRTNIKSLIARRPSVMLFE